MMQPPTMNPPVNQGPDPRAMSTLGTLIRWILFFAIAVVVLRLVGQTIRLISLLTSTASSDAALLASGGGMLFALVLSIIGLVLVLVMAGLAVWAAILAQSKGRLGAIIVAVTPFLWWVLEIIVSVIVSALGHAFSSSGMVTAGTSLLSPVLTLGFAALVLIGWNLLRTWHRQAPTAPGGVGGSGQMAW